MYKVTKYVNKTGKCPFDDFISDLLKNNNVIELSKIDIAIKLLEQYGYSLPKNNKSYAKHLEGKLYELRPGKNRIIYFFYKGNQEYVLLHGFHKSTQKTPKKEIELAISEMNDYERMKKNER